MKVLLIGSGGREHALAWKLGQSPLLTRLFATPGNPGIAECAELVAIDPADHRAVVDFCLKEIVDLVVVGPEAPLVAGIVDDLAAAGIRVFGPTRAAAALEGSKRFTKALCAEAGIPTAAWRHFRNAADASAHVREHGAPIVVKADGLAAGKGVTVAATVDEALAAVAACFAGAGAGRSGDRGIPRPARRQASSCSPTAPLPSRSARRRTTSASAMATPAPIPAAWAPIHRRRR